MKCYRKEHGPEFDSKAGAKISSPLYYAVRIHRRTKYQQEVIDALIEYSESVLDRDCGKPEYASPYLSLAKEIENLKSNQIL